MEKLHFRKTKTVIFCHCIINPILINCLFLQFADAECAKKALDQLNGFELAGRPMKVGNVTERSDASSASSFLDNDELERTGIDLGTTGRLQLMARLAEGTDVTVSQMCQLTDSNYLCICSILILHCCKLIYTCLWDVFRYWTADACCCQARLTDERLCGIWKSGKWCVFWVIFVFLSLNPLSWMEFEVHWGLDNFPPWDIWQIWVELVDLLFCSEDRRLTVTVIYVFLQPQPHNPLFPIPEWTKLWTFRVSRWPRTVYSSPTCSVHSRELH